MAEAVNEDGRMQFAGRSETQVERGFEVSRLEKELLARAYEQIVPVVTGTRAVGTQGRFDGAACLDEYYHYRIFI